MKKDIKEIKRKILEGKKLTSEEKQHYILYALTAGSAGGKMHDFTMLTTSCLNNPLCIERRKIKGLICAECYAASQLEYQKTCREKMLINSLFFSKYELKPQEIPIIYTVNNVLRFDSHGDCINRTNAKNYYSIARKNKHLNCAIWSKNPWFYKGLQKPDNLIFVFSIAKVNQTITEKTLKQIKRKWPFVDKIFSVYDPQFIQDNNITINCGGLDCMGCLTCYLSKTEKNLIFEKLK